MFIAQHVDDFVVDISYDGATADERAKIRALKLSPQEWARVDKFAGLLAVRSFCGSSLIFALITTVTARGEGAAGVLVRDCTIIALRNSRSRGSPSRVD